MPCILMERKSPADAYMSHCSKMININTPYFKNVDDAYKGDKPICPKCRKILNLEKKAVKKSITSIKAFTKEMVIYFNDKTKITLTIQYNEDTGYFIEDFKNLDSEFFEQVQKQLRYLTKEQTFIQVKRMSFDEVDLTIIEKLLNDANQLNQLKISLDEIEKLKEIKRKFKIHVLNQKMPYC